MKYKLSIVVITMNRAEQLKNALVSCFNCKLPEKTEFVIIDNASTDNTEEMVNALFAEYRFPYKYAKEEENRGVGGGRNIGFENAEGEYCYFLDDDAIIAPECHDTFFTTSLEYFAKNERISSITTRIYDEALLCDRDVVSNRIEGIELPVIFIYLGGSHFLRREYYEKPLYIDIKYGHEEIIPSIFAIDKGKFNCYMDNIRIIHQPRVNKWQKDTDVMYDIACNADANILASKYLIYPAGMRPVLFMSFLIRLAKHFGTKTKYYKLAWSRFKNTIEGKKLRKISYATIREITKKYSIGSAL